MTYTARTWAGGQAPANLLAEPLTPAMLQTMDDGIATANNALSGFGQNDIELIERVFNANSV
jgi:hypothetical protein